MIALDTAVTSSPEVLVIDGNKSVIGKGLVQIRSGDDWVGCRFTEGQVLDLVKGLGFDLSGFSGKHTYFKFYPKSGMFFDLPFDAETKVQGDLWFVGLGDLRIVDEFNFKWGSVPGWFYDVPGCGASKAKALNEAEAAEAAAAPTFKFGDQVRNRYCTSLMYFIGMSVQDPKYAVLERQSDGHLAATLLEAVIPFPQEN